MSRYERAHVRDDLPLSAVKHKTLVVILTPFTKTIYEHLPARWVKYFIKRSPVYTSITASSVGRLFSPTHR
ncbi:hypothetical protein ACROYT_G009373 [Oculina patagonica]